MKIRSLGATVLVIALAAMTIQSHAQTNNQLERVRTFQSEPAVRVDSRSFIPQINDSPRPSADRPENPPPPENVFPIGELSNIVTGTVSNYQRTVAGRRFPGIGATGWIPPDPNLAVGPSNIVSVVNSDVAWFNKSTGAKLFQQKMNGSSGFFGSVGATNFVFDPKCWYDPQSSRFFVLALELVQTSGAEASKLLIAVSDDNNPTGTWFLYRIEAKLTVGSDTFWMDYPSLATNKDGVAVCGNMFGLTGSSGWAGVQFITMKKAPMLTGAATTVTSLRDPGAGSAQVSRSVDTTISHIYGVALSSNSARLYALQNLGSVPTVIFKDVAIPNNVGPSRNATSTNGVQLDSIDKRPYNSAYISGKIVTAHNTDVSSSDNRLTPRWYQFNTNTWPISGNPSLAQTGIVPGANVDHWMPAIGINGAGDISVLFSRASSSITADVLVSSRTAADAPGTMSTPIKLEGSLGSYNSGSRWGDFFDVATDPLEPLKFWGIGMVSTATGAWQTVIHSWAVSTPAQTAGQFDAIAASMYDGTSATGVNTDVHAVDGNIFNVLSRYVQRLGSVAAIELTYDSGDGTGTSDYIGIDFRQVTTIGTTGMWWLWNWTTNKYDHIGSWQQRTSMSANKIVYTKKNLWKYIANDGTVKVVVRTLTRPSVTAPYNLKSDQIKLLVNFTSQP